MSEPSKVDRNACRRKRRFSTRIKAEVNALAAMNSHAKGIAIYTYHCPVCDGHHLTKNPHRYAESKLWPKQA